MAARSWEFSKEWQADIIRDDQSIARAILYAPEPTKLVSGTTPRAVAETYLRANCSVLGIEASQLPAMRLHPAADPGDRGVEYRLMREKGHSDLTTVVFQQTYLELPIWQAGISVHVKQQVPSPNWLMRLFYWMRRAVSFGKVEVPPIFQVAGCNSTRHDKVTIPGFEPGAERLAQLKAVAARTKTLEPATLARQLGIVPDHPTYDAASIAISHDRLMVYRYQAAERINGFAAPDPTHETVNPLAMPLPPVPGTIAEGNHYVVAAIYFDLARKKRAPISWVALLEVNSLAILYLEPLAASLWNWRKYLFEKRFRFFSPARGQVFLADPMTQNNGPPPTALDPALNPLRTWIDLPNLPNRQTLVGTNVSVVNFDDPSLPPPEFDPPTEATGQFDFNVRTNKFAAVNAYFHCDRFFDLLQEFGFPRATYFPGTTFPLQVDHRGTPTKDIDGNFVNAECRARKRRQTGSPEIIVGTHQVVFALASAFQNPPIGLANDWRVVLHELGGHATLQNHVQSSHFKFAHSAGDSLAAILNDPESKAGDLGATFPWVVNDIDRRHDRTLAAGWGWDGPIDNGDNGAEQLKREEILASTHFRLYQALGGVRTAPVNVRWDAANYTAYLILRAILALDAATSPNHAAEWMTNLVVANEADWPAKGYTGGAYGKVIRWAFEKQGLFGGNPPAVDAYIDDGRQGEYGYQANPAGCPAIWNRHADDGQTVHQAPVPNVVNFAYVTLKNRGNQAATSVLVQSFQNKLQTRRDWPGDWTATQTPQRAAADVLPQSSGVKVGPFEWIPSTGDNFILMAVSADGDPNNLGRFSATKSIPDWRLVPHDNNLGMRKV